MDTKILNYRIFIEPDARIRTGQLGYAAYCPTLGLADGGDTIEEAIENMRKLIEFHLACLVKEKQSIPQNTARCYSVCTPSGAQESRFYC